MRLAPTAALSLAALTFLASAAFAQSPAPPPLPDARLSESQNAAMDEVAQDSLDAASKALLANPPALKESPERRLALLLIDAVMRDPAAAERRRVKEFHKAQVEGAVNEMETTTVARGVKIWKLYGDGFVVRTPTATLAFDVVMAGGVKAKEFAPWQDVYARLARQCDALFISSADALHADPEVAERFVKAGKKVCAPKGLWSDKSFAASIVAVDPSPSAKSKIAAVEGRISGAALGVSSPSVPSVAYVLHVKDGPAIARVVEADSPSIDQLRQANLATILLANAGLADIPRLAKAFGAQAVITGGENDLAQEIDARVSHGAVYKKMRLSPAPLVAMAWGEAFDFAP